MVNSYYSPYSEDDKDAMGKNTGALGGNGVAGRAINQVYMNAYNPGYSVGSRNPNSDTYASDTFADVTRAQYQDYRTRFQPYEKKLMSLADSEQLLDEQLSRISATSAKRFNQSKKNTQVMDSRYNYQRTGRVQNATDTQRGLTSALSISNAKNMSRLASEERRMGILSGSNNTRQIARDEQG